ncbi:hypothetical protein HPB47_010053, partial [Ixodes persulcatus]
TAPLVVLACVLLSSNVATPSRLLMVVSFAYAYVSTVMLAGGIVSPFTQTHLRLSLYFLLYHIVGSGFFVLSGGWLLTDTRGEVFAGVAGGLSMLLFVMLNFLGNFSWVFMYMRYISFAYALTGSYICVNGFLTSLDSTTSVFSMAYYGGGCFLFFVSGLLAFSYGYTAVLEIITADNPLWHPGSVHLRTLCKFLTRHDLEWHMTRNSCQATS